MSKNLDSRAKEIIMQQIEELGEINIENVMELIAPHFMFDVSKAREQAIRRKAHSLMSRIKGEQGERLCFSYKDTGGETKYINLDTTNDLKALNGVESQINQKFYGLNEDKKRITRSRERINGQMSIEDLKT